MKHSIRIYTYQVLDLFRYVTRHRGVCSCGETTPGFENVDHAVNASFVHLDNVAVGRIK